MSRRIAITREYLKKKERTFSSQIIQTETLMALTLTLNDYNFSRQTIRISS